MSQTIRRSASATARNAKPVGFPIVGVGASVGGLEAFTELLRHLPVDTGLGFVLVQHLDPAHESALSRLLTRATAMPVVEVTNNLRVQPDRIYVIPPNATLSIVRGMLKLSARPKRGGANRSIDAFLESLAADQRERAIGVILSGTANDGTLGLEAIKAEGGITFAQDVSAKCDSMPRNAVAAGCVDLVGSPETIAKELARIAKHPSVAKSPGRFVPSRRGAPASADDASPFGGQRGFREILLMLRQHSGVDFSLYKPGTLHRRVARRMVLNNKDTLGHYTSLLKGNPGELDSLYSDVLIGVTGFFRNREAFEALTSRIMPGMIAQAPPGEPLRVWVAGCSTGQEAYSIAMAFAEASGNAKTGPKLQVFATDLNESSLNRARQGLYAKSLAAELSPERLKRFFVQEPAGYRVNKDLREMVVFARQDLINDPPFSRMDLISCRNLLIYLGSASQERALATLHYALRPGGYLLLGTSESVGPSSPLFDTADKKQKIFLRKIGSAAGSGRPYPLATEGAAKTLNPSIKPAPAAFRGDLSDPREADRILVGKHAPAAFVPDPAALRGLGKKGRKPALAHIAALERELADARDHLRFLQREHETVNEEVQAQKEEAQSTREEMQAQSEELQSANEELQSINEELEISKDDLEAANGELTTLNEEMAQRNAELDGLNADLNNLQASTHTAVLLLGRDLTIRRFTPLAEKTFNLLATDLGRPLGAIKHNLSIPHLEGLAVEAIGNRIPPDQEVRDKDGRWYSLRIRPYLTVDHKPDGAVLALSDIDALKRSEQQSQAARDYAEAVIRTVRDPLVVLGADLRLERATEAFYKVFQLTPAQAESQPLFSLSGGLWNIPKLREILQDILPRNSFFRDFEMTAEIPGLGPRTLLVDARRLDSGPGGTQKILLSIEDVTERLESRTAMRRSEIRFRRLFETARDGILMLDPASGNITDANPFIVEFLGYRREELMGKQLWEIGLIKDEEASRAAFRELMDRGFVRYEDLPLESNAGEKREVEFVSNLYEEDGNKVIQCNIRDITERKKTEQVLSERARLLDLSSDAIMVLDSGGCIKSWSGGAEKVYGWAAREVMDKNLHLLLQTEFPRPREEIDAQLHAEGRYSGEIVQRSRDGRRVISLCQWILDPSTKLILASYADISARKIAEAEMIRERDKALAASKAKDDFFAALSHELRTPLSPILLLASEGADDPAIPAEVRETFATIMKNTLLEARLVDDLLDLTRITHGKMALDRHAVDLHAALQDAIATVRPDIEEKRLTLRLRLMAGKPVVMGDAVRLTQIFWNVLRNATKFTLAGGEIAIETVALPADRLSIRIADTGIGMTEMELERIFSPFSQGDHAWNGVSHVFGGLGLGLAISRMLAELHSGSIRAESPGLNQGSTIIIELPMARQSWPEAPPGSGEPASPPPDADPKGLRPKRILLVEDHEATRQALTHLLVRRGYEVAPAGSLGEARTAAGAGDFDLLISDVGLPDGSGYELMVDLRDRFGLKGIALTGYGYEEDFARSREAGFLTHLTKPVTTKSLERALMLAASGS